MLFPQRRFSGALMEMPVLLNASLASMVDARGAYTIIDAIGMNASKICQGGVGFVCCPRLER
jgi:hypothetical protein